MNWTNKATETIAKAIENSERFSGDISDMVATSPDPGDHVLDLCEYVETKMIDGNALAQALLRPTLDTIDWEQIAKHFID